jgi:hypothetical protein
MSHLFNLASLRIPPEHRGLSNHLTAVRPGSERCCSTPVAPLAQTSTKPTTPLFVRWDSVVRRRMYPETGVR